MPLISWNLRPRTAYLSIRSHAMERRSEDFTGGKKEDSFRFDRWFDYCFDRWFDYLVITPVKSILLFMMTIYVKMIMVWYLSHQHPEGYVFTE